MAGTLTIDGFPGPVTGAVSLDSGSTLVASWLADCEAMLRPSAPIEASAIAAGVQSVISAVAGESISYVGPGCPMIDDPLASPLREAAQAAGIRVVIGRCAPFWIDGAGLESGFSLRTAAGIESADLSAPVVVSGLMTVKVVMDAAGAVFARSERSPLTLVTRFGDRTALSPDGLDGLIIDGDRCPYALIAGPTSPLDDTGALDSLLWVVERLRAPDGCPWDRRQTHESLRRYLPEEAYEAAAAIEDGDPAHLAEELGDVLLQIALHAQIASETGDFRFADVVRGITEKMVHRHPHVFGDVEVDGVEDVLRNWEDLKEAERGAGESWTDGVSPGLPALIYARELVKRAARSGRDLGPSGGDGAMAGAEPALDADDPMAALGEMLLHLVELAGRQGLDPEFALREALGRWLKEAEQS